MRRYLYKKTFLLIISIVSVKKNINATASLGTLMDYETTERLPKCKIFSGRQEI